VAYVGRSYVLVPISLFLVRATLGIKVSRVIQRMLAPAVASALMVGVVALVREGCATWAPAFRLLVLAPVGGAIYVLALFVLARGTVDSS